MYVCMWYGMHMYVEVQRYLLFLTTTLGCFETRSPIGLKLTNKARLAASETLRSARLPSPAQDHQGTPASVPGDLLLLLLLVLSPEVLGRSQALIS